MRCCTYCSSISACLYDWDEVSDASGSSSAERRNDVLSPIWGVELLMVIEVAVDVVEKVGACRISNGAIDLHGV